MTHKNLNAGTTPAQAALREALWPGGQLKPSDYTCVNTTSFTLFMSEDSLVGPGFLRSTQGSSGIVRVNLLRTCSGRRLPPLLQDWTLDGEEKVSVKMGLRRHPLPSDGRST